MADTMQRSCGCGRPLFEQNELCPRCLQFVVERPQSRTRTGRSRYVSAERPTSNSPLAARTEEYRKSLDLTHLRSYRDTSASAAFTHAFTSEPDDEDDNAGYLPGNAVDLFPASVYRRSSRTPSRASSSRSGSVYSLGATPTPSGRSPMPLQAQPSDPLARPVANPTMTRDAASRNPIDRGYSPMAAGFARLSHKTSHSAPDGAVRAGSRDANLANMGARMFTGPA